MTRLVPVLMILSGVAVGCDGKSAHGPMAPTPTEVLNYSGDWFGTFRHTCVDHVQGACAGLDPQTSIRLILNQTGGAISGQMRVDCCFLGSILGSVDNGRLRLIGQLPNQLPIVRPDASIEIAEFFAFRGSAADDFSVGFTFHHRQSPPAADVSGLRSTVSATGVVSRCAMSANPNLFNSC